jgi:hypothetical protein
MDVDEDWSLAMHLRTFLNALFTRFGEMSGCAALQAGRLAVGFSATHFLNASMVESVTWWFGGVFGGG